MYVSFLERGRKMNDSKLKGKDLINIGIYAAITCILMMAVSMIGFVPVLMPLIGIVAPLICGIPLMLFMTKVKKFGMVTIMGIIMGVFLGITGMGIWPVIFGVVCGVIADFINKSGDYKDSKKIILGNGVLNVLMFGCMVPLYINVEEYFSTRQEFGQEYIDTVTNLMQPWTFPILLIGGFLAGIVGALIGRKLLKKHFEKAGIA